MDVHFEDGEGEALDDDGNGRDEVGAVVVDMALFGTSEAGDVQLKVRGSHGTIEEADPVTPGWLDIPPFAGEGTADVTLEVLWEVVIKGVPYVAGSLQDLSGTFTHKPAGAGNSLSSSTVVPLLTPAGEPTGFEIGISRHTPNPAG